jgi:hypothetical protein
VLTAYACRRQSETGDDGPWSVTDPAVGGTLPDDTKRLGMAGPAMI